MKITKAGLTLVSLVILCALTWIAMPMQVEAKTESSNTEEVNYGQDFTRPLWRFDIREQFRKINSDAFLNAMTLRVDTPLRLEGGWIFAGRVDVPVSFSDLPSKDNPEGDIEGGLGDLLTQFVLIPPPPSKKFAWGFGAQLIWPTATEDNLGAEKYQVAPLLGAKFDMPWITKGSFSTLVLRYFTNYADEDKDRDDINQLAILPLININMPKKWGLPIDFINLWASQDIIYNNEKGLNKNPGDWFVPFDILLGKMISEKCVASVEFATPIINDYDLYDWMVEFRVGFFF